VEALSRCLLTDMVQGHPAGLLQPVESCGSNYSLGQQQLVCLARAFLNKSRLLLLDEATAALDSETDALVQRVVRSAFADRTILTIAHRLDTIIDADRILVMDAGRVAEFASPSELLRDEGTIFASLCRQAGAGSFATLKATADRHQEVLQRLQDEVRAAEEVRTQARSDAAAAARQ
jgi:ABC-type multidrug transport system fused ATPase/permease subunit